MPDGRSGLKAPAGVVLVTGDDVSRTVRPRLDVMGADVTRIDHLPRDGHRLPTDADLASVHVTIRGAEARFVVVAPLLYCPVFGGRVHGSGTSERLGEADKTCRSHADGDPGYPRPRRWRGGLCERSGRRPRERQRSVDQSDRWTGSRRRAAVRPAADRIGSVNGGRRVPAVRNGRHRRRRALDRLEHAASDTRAVTQFGPEPEAGPVRPGRGSRLLAKEAG